MMRKMRCLRRRKAKGNDLSLCYELELIESSFNLLDLLELLKM